MIYFVTELSVATEIEDEPEDLGEFVDTNYAVNSIERHRRGTSRDPGRSPKRPNLSRFTRPPGPYRFGAGAEDADFFIPSDAAYRRDAQRPPICTESEADPSKMAPDSVSQSAFRTTARPSTNRRAFRSWRCPSSRPFGSTKRRAGPGLLELNPGRVCATLRSPSLSMRLFPPPSRCPVS